MGGGWQVSWLESPGWVSWLETLTATPALHHLFVPGNRCPVINSEVGDPADGHPDPLS
jgi:hypothetical protein